MTATVARSLCARSCAPHQLNGTVCVGTSLSIVEKVSHKKHHDVVLAVDPMRRGQVYQSQAADVRHAYGPMGTISEANRQSAAALESGSAYFLDQLHGGAASVQSAAATCVLACALCAEGG